MSSGVVIVQQYQRMVVQKFGTYIGLRKPGFHFLIPIMYNGTKVDLREQVERVPTQKYITADNVVVDMDFVIYYRIMEDLAERSVLEVQNFRLAVVNLAFATLRAVIGATSLAEALTEREKIRDQMQVRMDEVTERWGVKVSQVEINEIDPPPGVKQAMEREKSAPESRPETVIERPKSEFVQGITSTRRPPIRLRRCAGSRKTLAPNNPVKSATLRRGETRRGNRRARLRQGARNSATIPTPFSN